MATVLLSTAAVGVYATYSLLQSAVIDWSQRDDLAAKIPAFIEMAEHSMFRELPLRATETSITGTTSGDTIALPTVLNAIERVELVANGIKYTLTYTSPNSIENLTISSGQPSRYTIEKGSLRLLAAPSGAYTYTIFYLETPAFLSASNPSNVILDSHSDLYLWGALTELARYVMDADMETKYITAYGSVLDSIRRADERRRFPASGGLQIRPRGRR